MRVAVPALLLSLATIQCCRRGRATGANGDDEDLVRLRQAGEAFADRRRRGAANAGVDFIEDQRAGGAGFGP